jgi:hypothetical protein
MSEHQSKPWRERCRDQVRPALLVIALLGAVGLLYRAVAPHYPIGQWLFWIYAKCWLLCGLFATACLCAGHQALQRVLPTTFPFRERMVFSAAAGILVFFLAMFVGGILRLYGVVFAFGLPLLMIAAGGLPLYKRVRRYVRKAAANRHTWRPLPWWTAPVLVFGVFSLGMTYFSILTPKNIAFDARFYHLALSQEYAAQGAFVPDPIGWWPAAMPQLASVLYTWAFLIPGPGFDRLELASHVELTVFLGTLSSIPVLVRWLVPRARTGLSWVAVFLFPGIFLYDSSLITASDHVAAFWAVPIYLAFRRAFKEIEPRYCALLSMVLAGALLTKYSAVVLLLFPVFGLIGRSLFLRAFRHRKGNHNWVIGPLVAAGVGLVLTAPHWLKNWVWYDDPFFPYLHSVLGDRWHDDALQQFTLAYSKRMAIWQPKGTLPERLMETAQAVWEFSFVPHNWPKMHGKVPVFGSLFTLSVLILPWLRNTRRVWPLLVAGNLGVFVWYWNLHQDRYLQVLLPWMAAVVAATIALAWREGLVTKLALAALVGLQVIWGGDVYFFGTHSMTGDAPIRVTSTLISQGYRKKYDKRFKLWALMAVGDQLPAGSRVLMHEMNLQLGLFSSTVSDLTPWQFGLRYGRLESPLAMYERLRGLGITHVLWRTGGKYKGHDSLAGDLRFWEFATHSVEPPKKIAGYYLARMSDTPPQGPFNDTVAYLGCRKIYRPGLHRLGDMNVPGKYPPRRMRNQKAFEPAPKDPKDLGQLVDQAAYVVTQPGCRYAASAAALESFVRAAKRGKEELWIRRRK